MNKKDKVKKVDELLSKNFIGLVTEQEIIDFIGQDIDVSSYNERLLSGKLNEFEKRGLVLELAMKYRDENLTPGSKDAVIQWISNWYTSVNPGLSIKPIVIGVSGGLDSSVVLGLTVNAIGKNLVRALILPYGEQRDIDDAIEICEFYEVDYKIVNIKNSVDSVISNINSETFLNVGNNVIGNIQSRMRMVYLYAYSQELGGFVSNNCNLSERYIGYSTIFGDMAGDFSPLSNLTKTEVINIAEELEIPKHLIYKTPIDGLANNLVDGRYLSDEESMGFTYEQLDKYINTGSSGSKDVDEMIDRKHKSSYFKRMPMAAYQNKL